MLNYSTGKKLEKFLAAEKAKSVPLSYADLGPACPGQTDGKPFWKAAEALFDGQYREKINLSQALANLYEGRPIDRKRDRSSGRRSIGTGVQSIFFFEAAGFPVIGKQTAMIL